jgi:asparagine synthase (glutamine-hydrolysing)
MCGIAGWVSYDGDLNAHWNVITKMTKTMALRGPDAGGVWIDRHVGLGHRRLAVIDLAGGVQPMQADDDEGRTIASLIYTGEVYNFVELRDELSRLGHRFKTQSDTEVVLRGYLQWGDKVVERLNGMFAFAIWDVRSEELFLVRDRMGVKPLFYYPTPDGVLFGSEPKAILAHPGVEPRVNKDGFREILVLAKTPETTIYAGMHEVRPGQVVRVSRAGLTKRRYWMLTAHAHEDDLPRTVRTVSELVGDGAGAPGDRRAGWRAAALILGRFRQPRRSLRRERAPQFVRYPVRTGFRGPCRLRSHRGGARQPRAGR